MRCLPRHFLSRRAKDPRGIETDSEAAKPATGHAGHCTRAGMYARRKGEHGSAILESFFSMILLGMILFGILQLFQLAVADMITDYAAFRGARSAAVGFRDEYAFREAEIKAAPVSGRIVRPDDNNRSLEHEKSLLTSYMEGQVEVEYSAWCPKEIIHTDYHCPEYGQPLLGGCSICNSKPPSDTNVSVWGLGQTMRFKFEFVNYPLNIPLHDWLTGRDSINISGEAELTNHSSAYLE